MVGGNLFDSRLFYIFNIGNYIVNGPDTHGFFLFLASQGKIEDGHFNLPEKLNGVDTVETVVVTEVVIRARFFEFKVFGEDGQYCILDFVSGHNGSEKERNFYFKRVTYLVVVAAAPMENRLRYYTVFGNCKRKY
jgi:hypothetical protein